MGREGNVRRGGKRGEGDWRGRFASLVLGDGLPWVAWSISRSGRLVTYSKSQDEPQWVTQLIQLRLLRYGAL